MLGRDVLISWVRNIPWSSQKTKDFRREIIWDFLSSIWDFFAIFCQDSHYLAWVRGCVIPVLSPHKLVEIPLRDAQTSFDYQAFLLPAPHGAGAKSLFLRNDLKKTPRRHFSQAQGTYFGFSFRRSSCDLVIRTMNISVFKGTNIIINLPCY